jgi:hypothetical protein
MRAAKIAAIAADRDAYTKQAFAACVAAAKDLVAYEGPIRSGEQVGRLVESEWGRVVGAVVWAWVATRAEQAASEGWNSEKATRATSLVPDPWIAGAIASALPALADACAGLDWSKPVSAWPKDDVVGFLEEAFRLVVRAIVARDTEEERIAGKGGAPDAASALIAELDRVPPLFEGRRP